MRVYRFQRGQVGFPGGAVRGGNLIRRAELHHQQADGLIGEGRRGGVNRPGMVGGNAYRQNNRIIIRHIRREEIHQGGVSGHGCFKGLPGGAGKNGIHCNRPGGRGKKIKQRRVIQPGVSAGNQAG